MLIHRIVVDVRSNDHEPRRSLVAGALEAVPAE